jgi:hypothetical protein
MSKTTAITVLPDIKTIIGTAHERLAALEESRLESERRYQMEIIPYLLKQGLHCLKAHCAFAVQDPKKRGAMKGRKSSSRRDELEAHSFEGWLSTAAPYLKKGAAYKYMTAVRGLGLDDTAAEEDIDSALAARGITTIKALCDATLDPVAPAGPPPPTHEQQEFDFLRQNLSDFRVQSEKICQLKSQLAAYPDFQRAATARVYSMLWELTGTHWTPSDEADALAHVDPDSITI